MPYSLTVHITENSKTQATVISLVHSSVTYVTCIVKKSPNMHTGVVFSLKKSNNNDESNVLNIEHCYIISPSFMMSFKLSVLVNVSYINIQ